MLDIQKRAREEVEDRILREWVKQERRAMQQERERREQWNGKFFVTPLGHLGDEECKPIEKRQLKVGMSVFWVDEEKENEYPVTVVKVIVPGSKLNVI